MFGFGPKLTQASATELQDVLKSGRKVTVIDVREPWEYAEGHVPGSVLRPLGQIRTWASEFSRDADIYLICRTGARSGNAYQFLQAMGFTKLHNVSGGMITWRGAVER